MVKGVLYWVITKWDAMQPWERIEYKLKNIEESIDGIRQDINSWRPVEWESYYQNDPFGKKQNLKKSSVNIEDIDLDSY